MAEKLIKAKALSDGIGSESVKAGDMIDVPESQFKYFIELGLIEEAPKDNKKKEQDKK